MDVRRAALALALALLLSGCGKKETEQEAVSMPELPVEETPAAEEKPAVEEEQVVPDEPDYDVPETEDHVLTSLSASIDGGQTLRLEAIGKKSGDSWGVREVRVYRGNTLLQTVQAREAIDGVSSTVGEGYTESPTVEDALRMRDMNFDGFDDLDLYGWTPANSAPHYFWLYNPESGLYQYAYTLPDAEAHSDTQELSSWYKYENGKYYTDYYRYADGSESPNAYHYGVNDQLVLIRREIEDWKNGTEDFPLLQTWEYTDGDQVLLTRQAFTDYDSDGRAVRQVQELVNGTLTLTRLEYLEVSGGKTTVVETVPVLPEASGGETAFSVLDPEEAT